MFLARLQQLIFFLECGVIGLHDELSDFRIRQVNAKVHIAKQEFVVVITFLARCDLAKVVKHLFVDYIAVFKPFFDLLLARL